MNTPAFLITQRLLLRRWKQSDIEPFAAINSDPQVMEFFPERLTLEETTMLVEKIKAKFDTDVLGLWAVEVIATGQFVGFVGLSSPRFVAHFTPCVEVGWRVAQAHWGKGYAPEAAREAIRDGFDRLKLPEIVSFTSALNKRSIRVMEKVGMKRNPDDDFHHPLLGAGDRLKPHVLYRISQTDWLAAQVH